MIVEKLVVIFKLVLEYSACLHYQVIGIRICFMKILIASVTDILDYVKNYSVSIMLYSTVPVYLIVYIDFTCVYNCDDSY